MSADATPGGRPLFLAALERPPLAMAEKQLNQTRPLSKCPAFSHLATNRAPWARESPPPHAARATFTAFIPLFRWRRPAFGQKPPRATIFLRQTSSVRAPGEIIPDKLTVYRVDFLLRRGARGLFRSPAGISTDFALAQRVKSLLKRAGDRYRSATRENWPQAGRAALTPGGRCLPALGMGHSGEKTLPRKASYREPQPLRGDGKNSGEEREIERNKKYVSLFSKMRSVCRGWSAGGGRANRSGHPVGESASGASGGGAEANKSVSKAKTNV